MSDEKKPKYFDLSEAVDEVRHGSYGAKDTAVAGLKLLGKGLFNVAKYTATEAVPVMTELAAKTTAYRADQVLKRDDLSNDQRDKFKELREKAVAVVREKEKERREAEEKADEEEQRLKDKWQREGLQECSGNQAGPSQEGEAPECDKGQRAGLSVDQDVNLTLTSQKGVPAKLEGKYSSPCAAPRSGEGCKGTNSSIPPALIDYLNSLSFNPANKQRIFVLPNIPADKLNNALKVRYERYRSEKALLLIDDTAFGSGKDGLLITDQSLSYKAAFCDPKDFRLEFSDSFSESADLKFNNIDTDETLSILRTVDKWITDLLVWHEQAAKSGVVDSQFYLSRRYSSNDERSYYWLIKAAENGHVIAQHNLGVQLMPIDEERACSWLQLAAHRGHELAKQRLEGISRRRNTPQVDTVQHSDAHLTDLMPHVQLENLKHSAEKDKKALLKALCRYEQEKIG